MKAFVFASWIVLLCALPAYSQSCFPEGLVFTSQQEVNEFKIFNPGCKVIEGDVSFYGDIINLNGLSNITAINGTLGIDDCDALTNLNGLANLKTLGHLYLAGNDALVSLGGLNKLTAVNGFFFIQDNTLLTNLNGLQNLQTVGGDFWIHNSPALTSLTGLSGLTTIGGEIWLNENAVLANLNGLSKLQTLGGGLSIWYNHALTDLSGLEGISTPLDSIYLYVNSGLTSLHGLEGVPAINGNVGIFFNPYLASIGALSGLTSVGGQVTLNNNDALLNLNGLQNISAIGGSYSMGGNDLLQDLTGLNGLQSVGGQLEIVSSPALTSLNGLQNLQSIGGNLKLQGNPALTSLNALQNLGTLSGNLDLNSNYLLSDLTALAGLNAIGGGILLDNNDALTKLAGLQNVATTGGELFVSGNEQLPDLSGLDGLTQLGGSLVLANNPLLTSLSGLQNLNGIGAWLYITGNSALPDLSGLDQLTSVTDYVFIKENAALASLHGLEQLAGVGGRFALWNNPALVSLSGLAQLSYIGGSLELQGNNALLHLNGLEHLSTIGGGIEINNNNLLADCVIPPICQRLFGDPAGVHISNNASGCDSPQEVEENCGTTPIIVQVRVDANGDCQPDAAGLPVPAAAVWLSGPGQTTLQPTDAAGQVTFRYYNNGPATLTLAQFPTANWSVCTDTLPFEPGVTPDTVTFLLQPLHACPELTVELGLPSVFSDCQVVSPVSVFAKNTGTITAENVRIAVVLPPEFDLLTAAPPLAGQTGDTLYFDLPDLPALGSADVRLTVKTKCNGVPAGRALCWSAFGRLDNACPVNPPSASEIRLSAACIGGQARFTLQNIGNAATQGGHEYTIIRNGAAQTTEPFSLAALESKTVEVPADGATYRMEATQRADGTLTAVSLEGCGGLTPGFVTAFWQDKGSLAADFDCRVVAGLNAYSGKNAFPAGVGPDHLLAPNRPLLYTVDFRNTESSPVTQVLLRDVLPPQLNVNTFRPGAASHPYTWQIRHGNVLEVRFDPITLSDSLGNPADRHGFFTFGIDQQPDLSDGTSVENSAEVFFENNYLAERDTVRHTIDPLGVNSQKCLPNGIVMYYQEQVDNFLTDYPGCTVIEGDLEIRPWQDGIQHLQGLSTLRSVEGSVVLFQSNAIQDLQGLHNLRSIGRDLSIEGLYSLKDLSGLKNLRTIDSLLSIRTNIELVSLQGLDSLRQVKYVSIYANDSLKNVQALAGIPHHLIGLEINGNAALTSLQGLQHIDSIGKGGLGIYATHLANLNDLNQIKFIGGSLGIGYNHTLTNLTGLGNLPAVGEDMQIVGNTALTSLTGLDNLYSIGRNFHLIYNPEMITPGSLPMLHAIGGELYIVSMNQLEKFTGLGSIDSIGGYLSVYSNPSLTSLQGLDDLRMVQGINIGATALLHLYGLDSITVLPGNLVVGANPVLRDFAGLDQLHTIGGRLEVSSNPALQHFNGLGSLRSIGDSLTIDQNNALVNFSGLNHLRSIGNDFSVTSCPALVDFEGLDSLRIIGDSLVIFDNAALKNLNGLSRLDSIGDAFRVFYNLALNSLGGPDSLHHIGGNFSLTDNNSLTQLTGLEHLRRIGGNFSLNANGFYSSNVTSLNGLNTLAYIGGNFSLNAIGGGVEASKVTSMDGLEKLAYVGGNMDLGYNQVLTNIGGLQSLQTVGGHLNIGGLQQLTSLNGLEKLSSVGGNFYLSWLPQVTSLSGLDQLSTVGGDFSFYQVTGVVDLTGLGSLKSVGGSFGVNYSLLSFLGAGNLETIGGSFTGAGQYLKDFSGLEKLSSIGYFSIDQHGSLESLKGLENLTTIGTNFRITDNPKLKSLDGLKNLVSLGASGGDVSYVSGNAQLTDCAVFAICSAIIGNNPNAPVLVYNNAPGCNSNAQVEAACNTIPVRAIVRIDHNGDCLPDSSDTVAEGVRVQLSGSGAQLSLRATDTAGLAQFRYYKNGAFSLHLPQYPSNNWDVCQDNQLFTPGSATDSVDATFLLSPVPASCPELTVALGLPAEFRGCLVTTEMEVAVRNTGSVPAEAVTVAVIKPAEMDLVNSMPPLTAQSGDTLYFDLGTLAPLTNARVRMTVRSNCDFFLFERTMCWEASAKTLLACPNQPPPAADIRLTAECRNDTSVRFTLRNVGKAATQGPHQYVLYRNTTPVDTASFSLNAQESLQVDAPADGATLRMEATRLDNGTLTAAALEHCGGLTPGLITAFWLERGPLDYDFDCRAVSVAFDPNEKSAVPTGTGDQHFLAANRPLQYTIDFQNTGTDTAFRVLLRDVLDPDLDVSTFRPGFASHPYTWELRGPDTLEVLFFPIMLPDSNVNEPASHGFFTFDIEQKPDLPDGSILENKANIIFDFNPAIVTNTVWHTIGQLTVRVDEAQAQARLWRVLGNPLRDAATFRAETFIAGEKRFELYDVNGRRTRTAQFAGQAFEFRRDGLAGGLYFFKISDAQGRVFTGKIVIAD